MDEQKINTTEPVVTINIPGELLETKRQKDVPIGESAQDGPEIISVKETGAPIIQEQSEILPALCKWCGTNDDRDHTKCEKVASKPKRDEKGYFLKGNKESQVPENTGRPCEFCKEPVKIIQKINLYREWCRGKVDGKLHIPYIEELVSEEYLDITIDQFEDWIKSERHQEQHSELTRTFRQLMARQKLYLLKRTLSDNPRGAIFQLSANHGMIEQSKQYQAGSANEPIQYNIKIVPAKQQQELEDE